MSCFSPNHRGSVGDKVLSLSAVIVEGLSFMIQSTAIVPVLEEMSKANTRKLLWRNVWTMDQFPSGA